MQKQDIFKPSKLSSFVVSTIMILDALSMLLFGFFYLVGSANTDPIGHLETKQAILRQGVIVAVLAFIYFLACFLSLIYWHGGGRIWSYVTLGLGAFHLVGASYLLIVTEPYADSVYPLPYGSILLNLLLVVTLIYEMNGLVSLAKNSNA